MNKEIIGLIKTMIAFALALAIAFFLSVISDAHAADRYMSRQEFSAFIDLVTDAALQNISPPPAPANLRPSHRLIYNNLLQHLNIGRLQYRSQPYVSIVPPPPGWNINGIYIPSFERQYQLRVQEYALRQAQRPTKSQRFRQTIPKGMRFRR